MDKVNIYRWRGEYHDSDKPEIRGVAFIEVTDESLEAAREQACNVLLHSEIWTSEFETTLLTSIPVIRNVTSPALLVVTHQDTNVEQHFDPHCKICGGIH